MNKLIWLCITDTGYETYSTDNWSADELNEFLINRGHKSFIIQLVPEDMINEAIIDYLNDCYELEYIEVDR